jgi:hypothetical protein
LAGFLSVRLVFGSPRLHWDNYEVIFEVVDHGHIVSGVKTDFFGPVGHCIFIAWTDSAKVPFVK